MSDQQNDAEEARKALLDFMNKVDRQNKAFLQFYLEKQQSELCVLLMSPNYCTRDCFDWLDYVRANSN